MEQEGRTPCGPVRLLPALPESPNQSQSPLNSEDTLLDQLWLSAATSSRASFIPAVFTHSYKIWTILSLIASSILTPWSENFVHSGSASQALPFLYPWLAVIPSFLNQGTE